MKVVTLVCVACWAYFPVAAQEEMVKDPACQDSVCCYCMKQEILIEGRRTTGASSVEVSRTLGSTDDALRCAEGVDMTRRTNFASEPTIRGMSGGQLSVTIDGMKMVCACVDKMDPINAYVEVENLSKLEVVKGGGDLSRAQTIGGSINFVTAKPELSAPSHVTLESGYESASQLRFVRGFGSASSGVLSFRASTSVKRAGDFLAGGGLKIPRSGYAKENYKFDVSLAVSQDHTLRASYIGDNARNIGYPALIMDTRKTETHIISIEHEWKRSASGITSLMARAYANRIRHWMDDFGRSSEEINTRSIMPSMHMPMFGETRVLGFLQEVRYADADQTVKVNGEADNLRAFADMNMISLQPGIPPMRLVNIGDVNLSTAGLAVEYVRQVGQSLYLGLAGRCDYSWRDLLDETARNALSIYWQGTTSNRSYLAASTSFSAELRPYAGVLIRLTGSRSQRLPTHIENYGYFLYNPLDNSIYVGNPRLDPERSWQGDLTTTWISGTSQISASVYYIGIDNYIAGLTIIPGNPSNTQFPQAFRRFDNIGPARLMGAEMSGSVHPTSVLEMRATIRMQEGESLSLREPLPLIPPVTGLLSVRASSDSSWVEGVIHFSGSQHRVSDSILPEDPTAGFALIDVRGGIALNHAVEVRCGLENIFNRLYHEHTSINNLPGLGRNAYLSIRLTL